MNPPAEGADLEALGQALPQVAPAGALEIERDRSLGDRMAGRPGRVTRITLTGSQLNLALSEGSRGGRPVAEMIREVRGVVISRRVVPVAQWLELLAGELRVLSTQSLQDEAALGQTLADLGVRERGWDLVVSETDLDAGLRALPVRLAGRVPGDVIAVVERIAGLLADTLGRVEQDGSAQAHVVLRAATDYLPGTLRAYVALPPEWAATHDLGGGSTALDALRDQLAVLESGVQSMRDAALRADAAELLVNGRFLTERFAPGSL